MKGQREVCPECGSDNLYETILGRRRVDDGDLEVTEITGIQCSDCSADWLDWDAFDAASAAKEEVNHG